jgi:hypothetical protein
MSTLATCGFPPISSMGLPNAAATRIIVLSRGLAFPFSHTIKVELQRPACATALHARPRLPHAVDLML